MTNPGTKARNRIRRCLAKGHRTRGGIGSVTAAGVTDRPWDIEDIVRPVDEAAPQPGPRGPL